MTRLSTKPGTSDNIEKISGKDMKKATADTPNIVYIKKADLLTMYLYGVDENEYKSNSLTKDNIKVYVNNQEQTAVVKELAFVSESAQDGVKYALALRNITGNGELSIKIDANTVEDSAGNQNGDRIRAVFGNDGGNGSTQVIVDNIAPTVTITADKTSPTNADKVTYTFTFSEEVTGFEASDVTVENGTRGTFAGSGKTYTLEVTNSGNCTQKVSVAAGVCLDGAENKNTASEVKTIVIDKTAPKAIITGEATGVTDGLVRYFDATNNVGNGHSNDTTTWVDLSGNQTQYTTDNVHNVTFSDEGYASFNGTSRWVNLGAYNPTNAVTVEAEVTLNNIQSDQHYIMGNAHTGGIAFTLESGMPALSLYSLDKNNWIKLTYDEVLDINRTYHIAGTYDGTTMKLFIDGVEVVSKPATGNIKEPSGNTSWAIGANPNGVNDVDSGYFANINVYAARIYSRALTAAEIKQNMNADRIKPNTSKDTTNLGTNNDSVTLTIKFDEDIQTLDTNAITVTNGTKGALTKVSDSEYTLAVTGIATSNTLTVTIDGTKYKDIAGNNGTSYTINRYRDYTGPIATITADKNNDPTAAQELTYTITFHEPTTGFTADDITISSGTKGTFNRVSSKQFTLKVLNAGAGTHTLIVPAGACYDAKGNANGAKSLSVTIPAVNITYDKNYLENEILGRNTIDTSKYTDNVCTTTKAKDENLSAKYGYEDQFTFTNTNTNGSTAIGPYIGHGVLDTNKKYTWSVYVKASKSITVNVGSNQGSGRKQVNVTTDWQRVEYTFTPGTPTHTAFRFYSPNWQTGDILYIHSLEIAEVPDGKDTALNVTSTEQAYGSALTLTQPTREGYTFKGWYTAPVGGTKLEEGATTPAEDTTYYAQWEINKYYIDTNVVVDGTRYNSGGYNGRVIPRIKVDGVDKGFTHYYTQHLYGTPWEIDGLKIDDVEIPYKVSGTVGAETAAINIWLYTLKLNVNNAEYGSVSPTELLVPFKTNTISTPTTFTTSNNVLTLSDGRTATATPTQITGYTTAFENWSQTSGTISAATTVTANFTKTPRNDTAYVVNHYTHDLGAATYTLNSTDNLQGTSDSTLTIADLKKTIAGYTFEAGYITGDTTKPDSGEVTTTNLNADGSTVINIYYRPNYLYVQYHVNTGSLSSSHGSSYGISENLITYTGNTISTNFLRGVYGSNVGGVTTSNYTIASNGLHDYNNPSVINITKTGYRAKSGKQWITSNTGTGTAYNQGGSSYKAIDMATACGKDLSAGDQVITLYVNWEPTPYTITYELDGGTNNSQNPSTYNIESADITLKDPTKTGYTFNGWTGNGTTTATKNLVLAHGSTGDKVYTANWTANPYTIAFNGNGSTGGSTASQNATYDQDIKLNANGFTRAYSVTYDEKGGNAVTDGTATYTFAGWKLNNTGDVIANQATVKNLATTGTATLYAQWNSGSVTLPNATRTGYTFGGWFKDEQFTQSAGVVGSAFTPTANTTLYAKWTAINYTITYNLDGGSITGQKTSYNIETDTFTLPTPTKTGFTFEGWTGSNGTALQKTVTINKGTTGDKEYFAHWGYYVEIYGSCYNQPSGKQNKVIIAGNKANTTQGRGLTVVKFNKITGAVIHTASYDTYLTDAKRTELADIINNSTTDELIAIFSQDATSFNANLKTALQSAGIPSDRIYYANSAGRYPTAIFVGKGLTSSQAGMVEGFTYSYTPVSYLKIYVKDGVPQRETYSITYNMNGGTFPSEYQTYYSASTDTFSLTTPTKTGYTFSGWTGSNGSTAQASVSIAKGSTGDKVYTANWTANPYTIAFNGNGSTGGSTASQNATYDQNIKLNANGFTCAYSVTYDEKGGNAVTDGTATYTFAGWKLNNEGDVIANQATVKNLATTGTATLYAQWNSASVTLPNATRTGYTFGGWFKDEQLTQSAGVVGSAFTPTANTTLYAKWTAINYTVTADANGGTIGTATGWTKASGNASATKSVTYDSSYGTLPEVSRTGYTFKEWQVADNLILTEASGWVQGGITDATGVDSNNMTTRIRTAEYIRVSPSTKYKISVNNSNNIVIRHVYLYNSGKGFISYQGNTTSTIEFTTPNNCEYIRVVLQYSNGSTNISPSNIATANVNLTAVITDTTTVTTASAHTIKAIWEANKYTVVFNKNADSATGTMANQQFTYDVAQNLTANAFTRPGYTFAGWATTATGDVVHTDEKSVSNLASTNGVTVNLYAKWTPNPYTFTINPNGGTYNGVTTNTSVTQNMDSYYGLATPTRAGYNFTGWTLTGQGTVLNGNASGKALTKSGTFTETVKTDTDGSQYTNYKYTDVTAPSNSATWPALKYPTYSFTPGHTYRISAEVRLNTYVNLKYFTLRHACIDNDYSSTGSVAKQIQSSLGQGWVSYTMDRTYPSTTLPSVKGKTDVAINPLFEIYTCIGAGNTGSIDFDIKNVIIEDITANTQISTDSYGGYVYKVGPGAGTLTANWEARTDTPYVVNHYKQNIDGTYPTTAAKTDNLTGTTDTKVTPARETYTGFTAPAGQEVTIKGDGSTVVNYQYTRNSHTVTYNYSQNGGTSATKTTDTKKYEQAIDLTPTATKSGYDFVGWNTNKDAHTKLDSLNMADANVTLYAIFKKDIKATTYQYNNSKVEKTGTMYNNDANVSITLPTIANQEVGGITYNQRGWSTSNAANATKSADSGATVQLNANTTYYASYQAEIEATFYYTTLAKTDYTYSNVTPSTKTASAIRYMNYTGGFTHSNYTVPSEVSGSNGGVSAENYAGVSKDANSATVATPTTANTTFYAVYTEPLTFWYSDGTNSVSKALTRRMLYNNGKYGNSLSETLPETVAHDSANFVAWTYVATDYSSTSRRSPLSTGVNTLYAIYQKSVSITYNANNGTGAPSATSGTKSYIAKNGGFNIYNPTVTVSTTEPTRANYVFKGWYKETGATNKLASPGDSYELADSITFFAGWSAANYSVTSGGSTYYYLTLADAVSKADNSGSTITVLQTGFTDSSAALTIGKTLTINTNGKTVTMSNGITVSSGKTVTFTGNGTIKKTSGDLITNSGTVVVNGPTLEAGAITINGGNVTVTAGTVKGGTNAIKTTGANTVTIGTSGGTVSTTASVITGTTGSAIVMSSTSSTFNFYDGKIAGKTTATVRGVSTSYDVKGTVNYPSGYGAHTAQNSSNGNLYETTLVQPTLSLAPTIMYLGVSANNTGTITATKTDCGTVTFASLDPTIATVDSSTGAVTSVKYGTVTITATDSNSGKTATITVIVDDKVPTWTITVKSIT